MIINNLSQGTEQYYVRSKDHVVSNKLAAQSFEKVDATLLGPPPYTVSLRCNGIEGIEANDVVVSWTAPGAKGISASYPNRAAE
jgi:hypothetical protein